MPITGSTQALMYARSNVMRCGASRSDYYNPFVYITIGGTAVQARLDRGTLDIEQQLNEQPDTASLDAIAALPSTFLPTKGQEIVIGLGSLSNRIFAGHILRTQITLPRASQTRQRMSVSAIDYTWELGHKICRGRQYDSMSASQIVGLLLGEFAPNFTIKMEFGMPQITFSANHGETIPGVLTRLATLVGATWYVDAYRAVHFFITPETDGNSLSLSDGDTTVFGLTYDADLSQVRTRDFVFGVSRQATSDTAVGATSLAVDDVAGFASGGGYALAGTNEITYAGLSVASGPGSLTGIPASGDGSIRAAIANGDRVRVLAITSDGTAVSNMASLLGSSHDGYIDHVIDENSLTDASAQTLATADLDRYAQTGEPMLSYRTRSKFVRPGKPITVSLTTPMALSGDFTIQRVRVRGFTFGQHYDRSPSRLPMRSVEAGVVPRTLMEVLRDSERPTV